jgi:hypothetical protein
LKKYKHIVIVFLFAMLILPPAAYAAIPARVILDGSELSFDVSPQNVNGRTMVPMRTIFEAMGADVEWDGQTQTVTSVKDGAEIILTAGSVTAFKNGRPFSLDAAPFVMSGRTFVPLRAVAESFEAQVDWLPFDATVFIMTGGAPADVSDVTGAGTETRIEAEQRAAPEGRILTVRSGPDAAGQLAAAEEILRNSLGDTLEDHRNIALIMQNVYALLNGSGGSGGSGATVRFSSGGAVETRPFADYVEMTVTE